MAIAVFGLWTVSLQFPFGYNARDGHLWLAHSEVRVSYCPWDARSGPDVEPGWDYLFGFTFAGGWVPARERLGLSWPHFDLAPKQWTLTVPFWWLLAVVAIPTASLWYRDRRPPAGHCPSCEYNLTGNQSGRCPECGQRATA